MANWQSFTRGQVLWRLFSRIVAFLTNLQWLTVASLIKFNSDFYPKMYLSGGFRGGLRGSRDPPPPPHTHTQTKIFHFHWYFCEKLGKTKQNPFANLNPFPEILDQPLYFIKICPILWGTFTTCYGFTSLTCINPSMDHYKMHSSLVLRW